MQLNAINLNTAVSSRDTEDVKLRKACQDFEAVLMKQMLSKMRDTVPENDLFGSSEEEKFFLDMMDQETAQQIAKSGSMRIAEILYKQLSGEIYIQNTAKALDKPVDK